MSSKQTIILWTVVIVISLTLTIDFFHWFTQQFRSMNKYNNSILVIISFHNYSMIVNISRDCDLCISDQKACSFVDVIYMILFRYIIWKSRYLIAACWFLLYTLYNSWSTHQYFNQDVWIFLSSIFLFCLHRFILNRKFEHLINLWSEKCKCLIFIDCCKSCSKKMLITINEKNIKRIIV